jgi:hypothetical protein
MFDSHAYGEEIARLLALDGDGLRPMPLARVKCATPKSSTLAPPVRAGLYVYFGCWDEAHTVAQDLETPEGSYWHAIVHRLEPDAWNSAYWYRKVGRHAIFPSLRARAAEIGVDFGPAWDPFKFIDYCEHARVNPGSPEEARALAIQLAEWQLLFDWCARKA